MRATKVHQAQSNRAGSWFAPTAAVASAGHSGSVSLAAARPSLWVRADLAIYWCRWRSVTQIHVHAQVRHTIMEEKLDVSSTGALDWTFIRSSIQNISSDSPDTKSAVSVQQSNVTVGMSR
eukprot:m.284541 g.284541  ORF g.284541 m.284541 type:complete len:121 (+) comp54964_c1_seq71:181-543(+)